MTHYIELDWEESWAPLYGRPIEIPENTILWRSYDISYPSIGDRFAYYSSELVAKGYKSNTRELGHFVSKRPLRLLDYRFMRVLLTRLLQLNPTDKSLQYLASIMLSFGLCSLDHQIKLTKMRYSGLNKTSKDFKEIQISIKALEQYYKPHSIIEQTGVRIAETTNDTYTMGFLQELFKGVFDGFISPRLYSPFHTEKPKSMMSPEIILFNPKLSGITELSSYPKLSNITVIKINDLLKSNHSYILIDNLKKNKNIVLDFFMYGGILEDTHYLDKADNLLNNKDSELLNEYNNGRKMGMEWNKKIDIRMIYTPSPCIPVSPFQMEI